LAAWSLELELAASPQALQPESQPLLQPLSQPLLQPESQPLLQELSQLLSHFGSSQHEVWYPPQLPWLPPWLPQLPW
jgi:hypothetical protein